MRMLAGCVLRLTLMARAPPEAPCTTLLRDQQWQVLYGTVKNTTALPPKPPLRREAVLWSARRGGFLARKSEGPPGTILLWRGWKRRTDLTPGWRLAAEGKTCG